MAVAQELGVLGHQGDAGAVRGAVEQRVGGSSDGGSRADGAGELGDGGGDSGHDDGIDGIDDACGWL